MIDELAEHATRHVDRRLGVLGARVRDQSFDIAAISVERLRRASLLQREEVAEAVELKAKLRALVLHPPDHNEFETSVATAMHAIPSPRPIQPMPSFVFPFTLTAST